MFRFRKINCIECPSKAKEKFWKKVVFYVTSVILDILWKKISINKKKFQLFCPEGNRSSHPTSNYTTDRNNCVVRKGEGVENVFLKFKKYTARAKRGRKFCIILKLKSWIIAILTYFWALYAKKHLGVGVSVIPYSKI